MNFLHITAFLAGRRHIWKSLLRCTDILVIRWIRGLNIFRGDSWDSWFLYSSWSFVNFVVLYSSWFENIRGFFVVTTGLEDARRYLVRLQRTDLGHAHRPVDHQDDEAQ